MANVIDRKSLKAATGGPYIGSSRSTTHSGGPNMPGDFGGTTMGTRKAASSSLPPRRRP